MTNIHIRHESAADSAAIREIIVDVSQEGFGSGAGKGEAALIEQLRTIFKTPHDMVLELEPGVLDGVSGMVEYPPPWHAFL